MYTEGHQVMSDVNRSQLRLEHTHHLPVHPLVTVPHHVLHILHQGHHHHHLLHLLIVVIHHQGHHHLLRVVPQVHDHHLLQVVRDPQMEEGKFRITRNSNYEKGVNF